MDFGRRENLDGANLALPPDYPATMAMLGGKKSKQPARIFIGCPVWADPKMVGRIYPKGTKAKDFLKVYATVFNAIELNATGYNIPAVAEVEAWTTQVTEGFHFCPKISQQIARSAPLGKDEDALKRFIEAMHAFGSHLGPVLLQLHPSFSPQKFEQLFDFIGRWDSSLPLQVELRHPDWFHLPDTFDALTKQLTKTKTGFVITDVTGRRDALHQCLTTKTAFIRFDGHDLHPTDFTRLDEWAVRVREWIEHGLESLYFFVHTPEKYLNPDLAAYFRDRLMKN